MKETYAAPQLEVIHFDQADVITTSSQIIELPMIEL